jgi:thiamine pyrophosphate-dependent acetolactate synthase large subunit-like protein
MKVYQAAADAFVKEGVTTVFGLMGDGNMSWAAVMSAKPGVRKIDVRDEGAALPMAEGRARATGKIGVCNVTHGPGITRMTASLVAATKARAPVVAEAGTIDPREASRVIDETLAHDVGIAIGVGHSFAFPVMIMKKPRVLHEFVNGFGSIGL